ncbi:ABC transporter ATP-binding protein, partial [Streptomyces sp. 4503]|nr:ABC transporter ATP-binding protein [Streptomyces niphimycinicus]
MSGTSAPRRGPAPAAGPGRFMGGQPTERSLDFRGSGRRLLARLRPERGIALLVLALGTGSVALAVV